MPKKVLERSINKSAERVRVPEVPMPINSVANRVRADKGPTIKRKQKISHFIRQNFDQYQYRRRI